MRFCGVIWISQNSLNSIHLRTEWLDTVFDEFRNGRNSPVTIRPFLILSLERTNRELPRLWSVPKLIGESDCTFLCMCTYVHAGNCECDMNPPFQPSYI